MVWIVPFMSISLGTPITMGLVNLDASGTESDGANDNGVDEDGRRQLSVASGALLFLQITSILTVAEVTWTVVTTVTMTIFIQQLAIVLAVIMIGGATIVVKRKWWDKRHTSSGDDDY